MWAALQHHCFQRKTCLDSLQTQVPENNPALSISPSTVLRHPHEHEVFFILLPQTLPVSAGQRKKKKKVHILSVASNLSLKETKRKTAEICKKICEYYTLSILLRSRVCPVLKNCTHGWALTSHIWPLGWASTQRSCWCLQGIIYIWTMEKTIAQLTNNVTNLWWQHIV